MVMPVISNVRMQGLSHVVHDSIPENNIGERFKASTGRIFPIESAWQAFVTFKQQPEPFLIGIVDMVLNPSVTLEKAMQIVTAKLVLTENHEGAWAALDARRA